jgi:pseudaminic acid cytidylyltransferase
VPEQNPNEGDGAMQDVIVLPARGGSKRIPRKNIRPFFGVPILARAISTARSACPSACIIVSTDDPEIADVAREAGAEVPFMRPASLSDDYTGTTAVMAHVARTLSLPDACALCCLYPTTPLLRPERLSEGRALLSDGAAFTFAALRFTVPPQRALLADSDGFVRPAIPSKIEARSQDLDPWFHDAGQFYWGHAGQWISTPQLFLARTRAVMLGRDEVCDIDTPDDWTEAERRFAAREGTERV